MAAKTSPSVPGRAQQALCLLAASNGGCSGPDVAGQPLKRTCVAMATITSRVLGGDLQGLFQAVHRLEAMGKEYVQLDALHKDWVAMCTASSARDRAPPELLDSLRPGPWRAAWCSAAPGEAPAWHQLVARVDPLKAPAWRNAAQKPREAPREAPPDPWRTPPEAVTTHLGHLGHTSVTTHLGHLGHTSVTTHLGHLGHTSVMTHLGHHGHTS